MRRTATYYDRQAMARRISANLGDELEELRDEAEIMRGEIDDMYESYADVEISDDVNDEIDRLEAEYDALRERIDEIERRQFELGVA